MSYAVRFAPEARNQLDALEDYIAQAASLDIAARYIDAVVSYCESLGSFPLRGTMREDLLPGLRITNYRHRTIIAFRVDAPARTVSILGVFHGGRDIERALASHD